MEYIVAKIGIHGAKATVLESNAITLGLTGSKVQLIYDDELWGGLRKKVVFKGAATVEPDITDETLVELPQQVTLARNVSVSVGITGINADGSKQIPTVWATIGTVKDSAYGDYPPPAAPLKPEWAQVVAMIGTLSNLNTETKENLVAAVNEVLSKVGSGGSNVDLSGYVKSVNGVKPDPETGNVKITIPDSGQNATLSDAEKNLILTLFRNATYISDDVADTFAQLEALWSGDSGGEEEPDEPVTPEKTLTSISATYIGGDVAVGTAVTALTGIVVTAHYSDGTSETVTGYTLSGSIAEGENTVTVSYGGKTTTFTVTGMAESGGDAVNLYSGQYLKSANIDQHSENGNAFTYTPAQNGSSITYTIEGLEADKEYTIFVESTRIDGGSKYTQVSVNTGSAASYDGKLVSLYPSWAGAGKNYATFTANGKTMYLWCTETGGSVAGQTVTLTVYIYPGTLTEKP